ncbi:MAG: DUF6691 family protein [Aestuariibacter sp.]
MKAYFLSGVISLIAGIVFGFGLSFSQMLHPQKVLGFLNIVGEWDGSLLLVMIGAMAVYASGYWLVARNQSKPLFAEQFHLPTRKDVDYQLLIGSSLFGLGWGIAGICPGPAIANLVSGNINLYVFVATMILGLLSSGSIKFERK